MRTVGLFITIVVTWKYLQFQICCHWCQEILTIAHCHQELFPNTQSACSSVQVGIWIRWYTLVLHNLLQKYWVCIKRLKFPSLLSNHWLVGWLDMKSEFKLLTWHTGVHEGPAPVERGWCRHLSTPGTKEETYWQSSPSRLQVEKSEQCERQILEFHMQIRG